jgi:DNA-directed RNA polymerase subunit beta'
MLSEDIEVAGEILYKREHLISRADALAIEQNKQITAVVVRSPMTCKTLRGVCKHCYGIDLTSNKLVDLGEAVGTVAAQAIGEPGTQLTMNTKHAGGAASVGGDVTSGLPRVEEVFEKRLPKNPAIVSTSDGIVSEIRTEGRDKTIVILPEGTKKKDALEYEVHYRRTVLVSVGEEVKKGQIMTDGSADLTEVFKYGGEQNVQDYVITETSRIYELQGVTIARKHIELIVKQMLSRLKVTDSGDGPYTVGDVVEEWNIEKTNRELKEAGKELVKANKLILGITEVSLSRKSFLSAASFQNTTRILIGAAVRGSVDTLSGLKENVIIGRLIPAGTGFKGSRKQQMVADLHAQTDEA